MRGVGADRRRTAVQLERPTVYTGGHLTAYSESGGIN